MVVCVCLQSLWAAEVPSRSAPEYILILHSYHKFTWTDHINEGINSVLDRRQHVSVRTEYMDTKWYQEPEYLQQLFDLYQRKYGDMKFDVVIVADDNAYNFARAYQASLFHGAPIVFCGVSDFDPEEIRGRPITGMVEIEPYEDMIDCAMTLLPSSRAMYVLADHSTTSQYNRERIESWANKTYPDLEIRRIDQVTHRQVTETLRQLPDNSFLMMAGWWVDADGVRIQSEEILAMLQESRRPVFWNAEYAARDGYILGGRCVIARKLGRVAGHMADRILDGEDVADIAPVTDTRQGCEYIFNYDQLVRFGLSTDNLPIGAEISNSPSGYFEVPHEVLWVMGGGLVGLAAVVCVLCVFMGYRYRVHKVLQEKEQRYRNLVEVNSDWMWEVDCRGVYTYVSPQVKEILGYEPEELLGKKAFDFMPPQEAVRVFELFSEIVKQRDSIRHLKNINLDWDGNEVVLETNGVPIIDKHGILLGYRGIDRDIAQRRRTEKRLQEQQEELESIFKASPTGIGLVCDRRLVRVNDLICEMTGYRRDELIGQSARMLYFSQEAYEYVGRERYRQIQEKGTGTVEIPWRRKDGSMIEVLLSSTPLDVSDLNKGVTFTAQDITERKQIAQQLAKSNAYLESVIRSAPTGITLLVNRVIQQVNKQFCEITGYSESELIGQSIRILYGTDEKYERVGEEIYGQIREKGTGTVETRIVRKDGREVDILGSGTPLDPENWEKGITFTTLDITARKKAEKTTRSSEEKFRALFEKSPIGIAYHRMVYDENGKPVNYRFLDANENYIKLTGVDPRGKLVTEAFPGIENDSFDWIGTFTRVARDGEMAHVQRQLALNDRWYDIVGFQTVPDHFVAVFLEITGQKWAEVERIRAFKFNEALLNAIPSPVFYKDKEGRYLGCNKAFEEHTGRSSEQIKGKTVYEVWPGEDAKVYHQKDMELIAHPEFQTYEFQMQDKHGQERDVIFAKDVFYDEQGSVAGIIGVFIDVTERKNAERDLRKRTRDLERFEKLAIGRELKMVELKKQIKELQKAVKGVSGKTDERQQ